MINDNTYIPSITTPDWTQRYQPNGFPPYQYPVYPASPCPGCGACPVCGRKQATPGYQQPQVTWQSPTTNAIC